MANMSYCRFQNTAQHLEDCQWVLEDMAGGDPERLSEEELQAAKRLGATCVGIVQLLAERGSLAFEPDMDLDSVLNKLNEAAG
jgi:hypothetical protein